MQDSANNNLLSVDSFTLGLGREKVSCIAVDRKAGRLLLTVKQYTSKDDVTKGDVSCEMIYLPVTFYLPLPLTPLIPCLLVLKMSVVGSISQHFPVQSTD